MENGAAKDRKLEDSCGGLLPTVEAHSLEQNSIEQNRSWPENIKAWPGCIIVSL